MLHASTAEIIRKTGYYRRATASRQEKNLRERERSNKINPLIRIKEIKDGTENELAS
jgi:hypothetical protein